MKAHSIKFSFIIVIIYFICLLFVSIPLQQTKANENDGEVSIGTMPSSGFLQADDLAPGDGVTATLKIYNDGRRDFQYAVSARLDEGASDLFDALSLTISDQQEVLYEGQLNELQGIPLGSLATTDEDQLTFTASLPKQVGNELQKQSASVAFDFISNADSVQPGSDSDRSSPTAGGSTLPQTATPIYNILIIGLVLIGGGVLLWRLRKSHKRL